MCIQLHSLSSTYLPIHTSICPFFSSLSTPILSTHPSIYFYYYLLDSFLWTIHPLMPFLISSKEVKRCPSIKIQRYYSMRTAILTRQRSPCSSLNNWRIHWWETLSFLIIMDKWSQQPLKKGGRDQKPQS